MKKFIDVVGAVIVRDGLIYCVQRGAEGSLPGMWEFPGGKIEPNETPQEALAREIDEELSCSIVVGERIETTRHEYDFGTVQLTTFWCELIEGTPQLTEHSAQMWLAPAQLDQLEWAPADIPAVETIMKTLADAI